VQSVSPIRSQHARNLSSFDPTFFSIFLRLICFRFVCATRTGNTEVAIFRSYDTTEPKLLFEECKIWEACRATSAATTFFDPIKIGKFGQEFADGGVLYNNPIQLVEREASATWPDCIESAVMVSIGTGSAPGGAFRGNLKKIINAMKEIATETEKTHNNFFRAHKAMVDQNRLYRFNVFHGLADVGLEESKEREKIANTTQTYLEKEETQRLTNSCIKQLCKPGSLGVKPNTVGELHLAR
jgi:predicted acylesterase/phospholipase RssA